MKNYLRELSFSEILKGCFDVYFHNFFTILIIYALPLYPLSVIQGYLTLEGEAELLIITIIPTLLLAVFAYAAITVALSDLCLGNKPSVIRSYKFVFSSLFWKLLLTNLLQILILMIGLVLLVVPGIIFIFWFIFVTIIVILENCWGVEALKRSKNLGKGFYLRTAGLLIVLTVLAALFGGLVGGLSAFFPDEMLSLLLINAIQILVEPLAIIMLVLSYYDLRVRKEAYDTAALAEDLQH